jgi:hypothetical protein
MFKLKNNDIKSFPFQDFSKLNVSQCEDLAKEVHINAFNSWMLPQINAYLGTWDLVKGSNGLIDPMATARKNITTEWTIGLWKVITKLKRGSLVKSQSNPEFVNYSALVPLVLSAQKRFNNVPYSAWDVLADCPLVEPSLLEAMLWRDDDLFIDGVLNISLDRLLEIRRQGLTTKSGTNSGVMAKPTSTWCLKGIRDTELAHVPKLVGTMLTQIWVAHPSLRTNYMILNPYDWDNMPEPLISEQIFSKSIATKTTVVREDSSELPWL